jgi:hypothetical protein
MIAVDDDGGRCPSPDGSVGTTGSEFRTDVFELIGDGERVAAKASSYAWSTALSAVMISGAVAMVAAGGVVA